MEGDSQGYQGLIQGSAACMITRAMKQDLRKLVRVPVKLTSVHT